MIELLIGIGCCLGMAGTLWGYLKWTKNKYYDGKDQSSLSNTFYHTGWKFRALLIIIALLVVYPVLLANGMYTSGGWQYIAPYSLLDWGKFAFAVAVCSIFGVALNADFMKKENMPYVVATGGLAAVGAFAGCLLREEWYVGLGVWLAFLGYYLWKQYKNKKAGNPDAFALYMEEVAFYSLPTCLAIFIIGNYLF